MKCKKYVVTADWHVLMKDGNVAGIDRLTNNAFVQYLEQEGPWDGYIQLGDAYDMNVISDHNKGKLKLVEGQRIRDDYAATNAVHRQHYTAAGKPKEYVLIEGNHEYRVQRYLEAKPELDGIINITANIPPFVKYVPFWSEHQIYKVGHASFIHGINSGSRQCAAGLRDYGTNVFMGHTHRRELLAMRYHGPDQTKIAESLPCLCEYGQPYLNGRPTAWQQGFAVFYFWPDGTFNHYVVSAFDHSFVSPTGKYYNGRKKPQTGIII